MASVKIRIPSETAQLRTAAIAGLPSVPERLMALYSTDTSLFLGEMDILGARVELKRLAKTLTDNGVELIVVKEELAKIVDTSDSKNEILKALFKRVDDIADSQGTSIAPPTRGSIKAFVAYLLEQDSYVYGKKEAYALAKALVLEHEYPLGNFVYARDQTNVVMGHRIVSSMAYPIRQDEIGLYEMVYGKILEPHPTITIPKGEIFEGGSLFIHNNTVFIDVDPRTTQGAAIHIFGVLHQSYPNLRFAMVKNGSRDESFKEQQSTMHLDMYAMPLREDQVVVCEEQSVKRHVILVEFKDDVANLINTNKSLMQYLIDDGNSLIVISKGEQANFGTNFLVGVGDSKSAIMSKKDTSNTTQKLKQSGIEVLATPVDALTDGFGGTHCSVSSLLRA